MARGYCYYKSKEDVPLLTHPPESSCEAYIEASKRLLEVSVLNTTVIYCDVAVCTVTLIVCYTMLAVMWSRSWSGMMHSRSRCGLVHVGIV